MIHLLPDLIILLILGLSVFFAYKRGFVKTLISAVSVLVALVVALLFASPVADALSETSVATSVREQTAQKIEQLAAEKFGGDALALAVDPDSPLLTMLSAVGVDSTEFQTWLSEQKTLTGDAFKQALITYVAEPVIRLILQAIAGVMLFVGCLLLLKLAGWLLTGVLEKIPFLRGANHALGLVLGILLGLLRVVAFCLVFKALVDASGVTGMPFFSEFDPSRSLLFRFLV